MVDVWKLLADTENSSYRVSFDRAGDGMLRGDYFPAAGEPTLRTYSEAWDLARAFANKTVGKCINIHIIDNNFKPIDGSPIIENRAYTPRSSNWYE